MSTDNDERIRTWIRFVMGFAFLVYFCFVNVDALKSIPLTFIIGACIFGSAWVSLWRGGKGGP